jgi:hypothetical protein
MVVCRHSLSRLLRGDQDVTVVAVQNASIFALFSIGVYRTRYQLAPSSAPQHVGAACGCGAPSLGLRRCGPAIGKFQNAAEPPTTKVRA